MKKIIQIILMALFTAMPAWADDVVINEQNFPDENFRNWVLNQEYGKDGVLTEEEIAEVTRISIDNEYEIHSLQGIEYFTGLTDLACDVNMLTSLDVSKNTALRYLICDGNHLTSLDVSGCKALTYLDCNNNQLTSLNVTGCESLKDLYCEINQLTSLNVSGCPSLVGISCYLNQLKGREMDAFLESLPNISNGILCVVHDKEWAMFYYDREEQNVMTTTQVAAAKAKGWIACESVGGGTYVYNGMETIAIDEQNFPDENFRNWVLSQEKEQDGVLTEDEIDVFLEINVNDKNIQSLKGIEYFRELRYLYCYSNQLTLLDVSKNTKLERLYCYDNQLTSLDVSGCKALNFLQCQDNQLTSLNVSGCKALWRLDCYNNQLTELDLSGCTRLTELWCHNNKIKDAAMDALVERLIVSNGKMYAIHSENEGNVMTTEQMDAATNKGWIVYYHDGNSWQAYLLKVAINEENFPDENFRNWVLSQEKEQDDVLTNVEVAEFVKIFVNNKNIQNLKGIEYFTMMEELRCYSNQLTSLDVSKNTMLQRLYCFDNQLTSINVSGCTSLKEIWCYNNQIKDAGMDAFVESLPVVHDWGNMYAIFHNENEGNVMTTTQVAAAKAKGWKVSHSISGPWEEYTGSDPADGIENLAADGKPANIYNIAGQRMKSMLRGINIIDGKKVMVK